MKNLKNIPELPGIYKMIDKNGQIIYIGKSISLKKRVMSYFRKGHKWGKIDKMVELIEDIEYETFDTHLEARLEECRLIKELQPIFNSQYKNDKKYLYLKVNNYNIYNSLSISYEREENCYGPFRSMSFARNLIDSLKNIYPIMKRNDKYDFKLNLIPKTMDKGTFNINRNSLIEILSNEVMLKIFLGELEDRMNKASRLLKFETASYYRNLMESLNYIKRSQFENRELYQRDIYLKIPIVDGYKLFYIKRGKILLKEKHSKLGDEIIEDFIRRSKSLEFNFEDFDKKGNMDFIDIIYSEIKSLAKDYLI